MTYMIRDDRHTPTLGLSKGFKDVLIFLFFGILLCCISYFVNLSFPYLLISAIKGWWSGGFCYGIWIGALVASGFSVVPVSSLLWKNAFKLSGSRSSKVCLLLLCKV